MNILITGATGFIGQRLVQRLKASGHEVWGLSRHPERAAAAVPQADRFYTWQEGELPPLDVVAGADAIVHLAGESVNGRWTDAKKQRILDSRIDGTRNLVNAITLSGVSAPLVSTSAVGFYGDRGDEELSESSLPGHGFLTEVTQRWEEEALAVERIGTRVAVLRLGIVMGLDGGALQKMAPLFRFGLGGPLGSGKQWWPWVHVDDVASVFEAALTNKSWRGIYNLTAPQPVRQKEFAAALGSAMGRPSIMPVPSFALRAIQGEFADEVLFSKRVLPVRVLEAGYRFRYPEVHGAMQALFSRERLSADIPTRA
jgi:uncharacterized protein